MSKIYNGSAPCKCCEKRELGCHSNCLDYTQWKKGGIEEPKSQYNELGSEKSKMWSKFYRGRKS